MNIPTQFLLPLVSEKEVKNRPHPLVSLVYLRSTKKNFLKDQPNNIPTVWFQRRRLKIDNTFFVIFGPLLSSVYF